MQYYGHDRHLERLVEALAKTWPEQQIVLLVDEICSLSWFTKLQKIPESVTLLLVANPEISQELDTLNCPTMSLTTPFRSTIAINSLARFFAAPRGIIIPECDFESVEGNKPIFFDLGDDKDKMEKALQECRTIFGQLPFVTLHNMTYSVVDCVENVIKKVIKTWEFYHAKDFRGWEAKRLVLLISRDQDVFQMITRAKSSIVLILFGKSYSHKKLRMEFNDAVKEGLVEKREI